MTPRPKIVWLDAAAPLEENWQRMLASPHSQFPVCHGSVDHVLGMVAIKEVWEQTASGRALDLAALARPALCVPESPPSVKALKALQRARAHAALVLDEYGGTEGLITLIDVLEAIVGDLPARGEPASAVRRADGSWLIDGMLPLAEFRDLVTAGPLHREVRGDYQTVGGLVDGPARPRPLRGRQF